jgi:hypothetical protein
MEAFEKFASLVWTERVETNCRRTQRKISQEIQQGAVMEAEIS